MVEAYRQLLGVGDYRLGQWTDDRPHAFHIRRRLTGSEAATVGEVCDLRGTAEAHQRAARFMAEINKLKDWPREQKKRVRSLVCEELGHKP